MTAPCVCMCVCVRTRSCLSLQQLQRQYLHRESTPSACACMGFDGSSGMNRHTKQLSQSGFREIFISTPTSPKYHLEMQRGAEKINSEMQTRRLAALAGLSFCSGRHYIMRRGLRTIWEPFSHSCPALVQILNSHPSTSA